MKLFNVVCQVNQGGVGGKETPVSGIFIKNVLDGSPAGVTGQLCTGDRILEVDGHDLRKASHDKAVDIIRQSGNTVTFVVQVVLIRSSIFSQLATVSLVVLYYLPPLLKS